jgi:FtsH-binding integral membrane protein
VTDEPAPAFRPWIAAAADLAVLVLFVLIGRRSHHEDAGVAGFVRVWWPFGAGLVVAWLVTRLDRAPLAWGRAVAAWLLTVAVGMALRIAVEGRDFKVAFTIVALVFVGAGMLGWRAVVRAVRARRESSTPAGL